MIIIVQNFEHPFQKTWWIHDVLSTSLGSQANILTQLRKHGQTNKLNVCTDYLCWNTK